MQKGSKFIIESIVQIPDFQCFSLIGDPGCDGLGAEIISIFSQALKSAKTDFSLILGDIVPYGSQDFYQRMRSLINAMAVNPVFLACGNHDTAYYQDYFGLKDYAIVDSRTLIIVLDNSTRVFSEHTLQVLAFALEHYARPNTLLAMHIPPPNPLARNSVSQSEWDKVTEILIQHQAKPSFILCGHLHSFFTTKVSIGTSTADLVTTGGGGARLENLEGISAPYYHIIDFFYGADEKLTYQVKPLQQQKESFLDENLQKMFAQSFIDECLAHVRYKLYAEDAERRGLPNLARLYRATSDSEFYHARNHFYTASRMTEPEEYLKSSLENERYEIEDMYQDFLEYARTQDFGLAEYAFYDVLEAEKVHRILLQNALREVTNHKDIPAGHYYVCSSCGYTLHQDNAPKKCPICGAPADKLFSCT